MIRRKFLAISAAALLATSGTLQAAPASVARGPVPEAETVQGAELATGYYLAGLVLVVLVILGITVLDNDIDAEPLDPPISR